MGDFNFSNTETIIIRKDFEDVWIQVHGHKQSTMVSAYRLEPAKEGEEEEVWTQTVDSRNFDRIMIRSRVLRPTSISFIGNQRIRVREDGLKKFPSDHFGLFCTVQFAS